MSNLVSVFLYFGGERIRTPYGVDYNTREAIVKVKITRETIYAELVRIISRKLKLCHGIDRLSLSHRYQTSVLESGYPYFSESVIADDDDVSNMFRISCQPNMMNNAHVIVDIIREDVYIP